MVAGGFRARGVKGKLEAIKNARENNKGWRIDYCLAAENMKERLKRAVILPEAKHSDHCPVLVEID